MWLRPGSRSILATTSNTSSLVSTQIGRIIIFFVHHVYFRTLSFYLLVKISHQTKPNPAYLIFPEITRDSSLFSSATDFLVSLLDFNEWPPWSIENFSYETGSSFSFPYELLEYFLEPQTPLWISSILVSVYSLPYHQPSMAFPLPQHTTFPRSHVRIYHHHSIQCQNSESMHSILSPQFPLSSTLTQVFLLKYFWTYNVLYFIHVINFLLSTASCLHFPFYPG